MVRAVVSLVFVGCGGCGQVGVVGDAGAPMPDAVDAVDAAPDAPMIEGLVAWYRMDVPTSGTIVDASGHDHPGICDPGSCPAFRPIGRVGGAYEFNGNHLFHVRSAAELESMQGFTVTAWINRADGSGDGCVINKSYQALDDNSWQACVGPDGELGFFSTDDGIAEGNALHSTNLHLGTSRWYHLALWWNGSKKAIYVDGESVADVDNVKILFDNADINIGSDIDNSTPRFPFRGQVDDVRIYNRALSPDEIRTLYTKPETL